MTLKSFIMRYEGTDTIMGDIIYDSKRAGDDVSKVRLMRSRLCNLPEALEEYNRVVREYRCLNRK